jgi:hypothetical protein
MLFIKFNFIYLQMLDLPERNARDKHSILKSVTKKKRFISLAPGHNVIVLLDVPNKLECLTLPMLSIVVQSFKVSSEPTRVKHLSCALI